MPGAAPDEKSNVYTGIIRRIQSMIAQGKLVPGDKLPAERRLAEQLGVSRSHLRQALQAMAERGVIESRQGDGTYLLNSMEQGPSVDNLLEAITTQKDALHEIIEFRQMIEPQIAALAAKRMTAHELVQLKVVVCDQQRALLGGREATQLDARFHQILAESTGNRALSRVMEAVQSIIDESRGEWLQSSTRRQTSVDGHLHIIDAIEASDGAAASLAMQRHLAAIEQVIFSDDPEDPEMVE